MTASNLTLLPRGGGGGGEMKKKKKIDKKKKKGKSAFRVRSSNLSQALRHRNFPFSLTQVAYLY